MSDAPGPDQAGPQTKVPGPTRPAPPTAPEHGGRRSLLLGIAGLLAVPLLLLGAVLSFSAVLTGVRARKRARMVLASAPGATAGIVLGSIGLALCAFSIGVNVFLWNEFRGYSECRQSALTISDHQACKETYFPRIERRLHLPEGSWKKYDVWD